MQNDDIRDQLEALRNEVHALSNAFIDLRREDIRRVYCNQIRPIFLERIDRFVFKNEDDTFSKISDKEKFRAKLILLIDRSISSYERNCKEEAIRFLDDNESDLPEQDSSGSQARTTSFALDLIKELKDQFDTSESILNRSGSSGGLIGFAAGPQASLSPLELEKILSPLANSWRVSILMALSKDNESLAALSKALGLKKGHLQFHLKCLLDSSYISYDRKSRLYSITQKGEIALHGMAELMERLESS